MSISSVSGGSIASAATIGGFDEADEQEPEPMYTRVRQLAGLLGSKVIFTETLLSWRTVFVAMSLTLLAALFVATVPAVVANGTGGWATVAFVVVGAPGFIVLSAIPDSLYGVQNLVELLTARLASTGAAGGATMGVAGQRESVRRIYCATDLAGGSHVYISASQVLAPSLAGRSPNLLLADVVAASAGFPGFRPLVFDREELTSSEPAEEPGPPRSHGVLARSLLGAFGVGALLTAVAAFVARLFGLLGGFRGFLLASAIIACGVVTAWLCARLLRFSGNVALVDGGVYDNLGAAFTALTDDDRYPGLVEELRVSGGGLLFVVDASKPFEALDTGRTKGLQALVPLRLRAAGRSVLQLIGNANSEARKRVIRLLLAREQPLAGALVSIADIPITEDDVDWSSIVAANQKTKTTLDALDQVVVRNLILHGYRVTEQAILELGYTMERRRRLEEFSALVDSRARDEALRNTSQPAGRYGRRAQLIRRSTLAAYYALVISMLVFQP